MKILIGTPIHEIKDYSMERWLENVAKLQKEYPAGLFLVDNSAGLSYVEKVKGYCEKYGVKDYRIEHFEVDNKDLRGQDKRSLNVELAQEMIRRKTLKEGYDAWFSWECDQIIPVNGLTRMVDLMKAGDYMMVVANSWGRVDPTALNANMGVTLISKEALNKAWFLGNKDGEINLSDYYDVDETMFKKRLLKNGGNYIEAYGVIEPIFHLNN